MKRASSHSDCSGRRGCFWRTSASTSPVTSLAARYKRKTTVMRALVGGWGADVDMERPHDMGIGRSRQGGIERSTIESVATESDVGSGARPGLAAIVWGGLLAGGLDITAAFVIYGVRGASPVRILQSIASGLLGAAAFQGGRETAALGALLHFLIALVAAAVYYAASRKLGVLLGRPVVSGLLYGVAVYVFMNFVVLPLSAVVQASCSRGTMKRPTSWKRERPAA